VSVLRLSRFILIALAIPAFAQTSPEQAAQLPSQAKPVQGVAMPVPKEIFRSLDQFHDANWRAVQRPEIVHWKSHGDQKQIATLLGVVIAEGFIAMEAKDSNEVKNVGGTVLKLAQGLGVEQRALRRSRSIMELADKEDWAAARKEWDGVLSDLENGMIELKSEDLSQMVSLGGWLRGTEALCALLLQNHSADQASLVRQPALIDYLEKQLAGMNSRTKPDPLVAQMLDGIRKIRALIENESGPVPQDDIRKIHRICAELVRLSSRRPSELPS
jgi:hypothetical protein